MSCSDSSEEIGSGILSPRLVDKYARVSYNVSICCVFVSRAIIVLFWSWLMESIVAKFEVSVFAPVSATENNVVCTMKLMIGLPAIHFKCSYKLLNCVVNGATTAFIVGFWYKNLGEFVTLEAMDFKACFMEDFDASAVIGDSLKYLLKSLTEREDFCARFLFMGTMVLKSWRLLERAAFERIGVSLW